MAVYECPGCGYRFDEDTGDAHEGYPPLTRFETLPDDFTCPDCGVRYKEDFKRVPGELLIRQGQGQAYLSGRDTGSVLLQVVVRGTKSDQQLDTNIQ